MLEERDAQYVRDEVWNRITRSYQKRGVALGALLVSLGALGLLHAGKEQATALRAQRYEVTPALRARIGDCITPHNGVWPAGRFATTDALFEALYAASEAKSFAFDRSQKAKNAIAQVTAIDGAISSLSADPTPSAATLAALAYARAAAVSQGAIDAARVDREELASREELRRQFDALRPQLIARPEEEVLGSSVLGELRTDFFDDKHPLYTAYQVIWTAALIISVLSLVYLVLAPIFRLLPFTGADEELNKRFEDLFTPKEGGSGDAPESILKTLLKSSAGIGSAIVISGVAVTGTALNAASSPWVASPPQSSVSLGQSMTTASDGPSRAKQGEDRPNRGGTPNEPEGTPKGSGATPEGLGGTPKEPEGIPRGPELPPTSPSGPRPGDDWTALNRRVEALEKRQPTTVDLTGVDERIDVLDARVKQINIPDLTPIQQGLTAVKADLAKKASVDEMQAGDATVANGATKNLSDHKREEEKTTEALKKQAAALQDRLTEEARALPRAPLLERIKNTDKYTIPKVAVTAALAAHGQAVADAVDKLCDGKPRTKTKIEWDLQSALVDAVGVQETRDKLFAVKSLVLALAVHEGN